jgi:dUTP pyrophosphatase
VTDAIKFQVRVMRLPHCADLTADIPLPAYDNEREAGLDLHAAIPAGMSITIKPGERAAIPTGLAFALPPDIEGQIRPRSGLALHYGITVLNTPGTVTAGYRGEVLVILVNLGTEPFKVERGARIAQLVFAPTVQASFLEVERLDETTRGIRGFGSTGTGHGNPST